MNRKKVAIISISFTLVIVLASIYFALDGGRIVGGSSDAKVVGEIPSGFIHLPKGGGNWDNGLHYVSWETQISFLDANGACIYQTGFDNSDFIVKYKKEYYINEEKFLELMEIASSSAEQKP